MLQECGVSYELLNGNELGRVEPALANAQDKLVGGLHLQMTKQVTVIYLPML